MSRLVKSYSYIDGIGDEVIYGLTGVILAVSTSIYMWFTNQNRQYVIHPENEGIVENIRDRIRHQQQPSTSNGTTDGNSEESHGTPSTPPGPSHEGTPQQASPRPSHQAPPGSTINCPICFGQGTFAIDTNCGHSFCGTCIIAYWTHGYRTSAVKCPVCRQVVTLLLKRFTERENEISSPEKSEIVAQVDRYNRRYSGLPRPWMDYIYDLPTLLSHCFSELFSLRGLYNVFRLRILAIFFFAILYLLSPFDIIPESIFGIFGLLDDLFVIFLLAIYVTILFRADIIGRFAG